MRAPFQVLAIPYIKEGDKYLYAVFKRKDLSIWQAIAGGGEGDESPIEAFRREIFEEAGIDQNSPYIRLSSITTIPAVNICGLLWGDVVMIPEFSFGVEVQSRELKISGEHIQYLWLICNDAIDKLRYDSNKSALWELNYRLENGFDGIKENIQAIKKFF